jgi:hypothetical protein
VRQYLVYCAIIKSRNQSHCTLVSRTLGQVMVVSFTSKIEDRRYVVERSLGCALWLFREQVSVLDYYKRAGNILSDRRKGEVHHRLRQKEDASASFMEGMLAVHDCRGNDARFHKRLHAMFCEQQCSRNTLLSMSLTCRYFHHAKGVGMDLQVQLDEK